MEQQHYTLNIELGLAQQQLHHQLSSAATIFSERVFTGCNLDPSTTPSTPSSTPSTAATSSTTDFHGFLKLEGCAIVDANITVPHFGKKNVPIQLVRDQHPSLVVPQLVNARNIAKMACTRIKSWLDINGRPALTLEESLYELLELRREIESARFELMGSHLPLYPTKLAHPHHPLFVGLPKNVVMEIGVQQAQLILFAWTIAPIPVQTTSKLVENVQLLVGKNVSGKEDALVRTLVTNTVGGKSNVASTGFMTGKDNMVVTQFTSCVCPIEPAHKMLQCLSSALHTCDKMILCVQNV